jgi:symplekin
LTQLKSRILRIWEKSSNEGVRIACIKFVEKVIITQTPGIKDPRVYFFHLETDEQLADKSDISSTIVPLNHPIIHLPALEAESQGFLDRMLALLIEQPMSVPYRQL